MGKEKETYWSEEKRTDLLSFLEEGFSSFSPIRKKGFSSADERKSLIEFITSSIGLSFSETILKLIDLRGFTDVQVYKAALVDRRVFSKLRSNRDYQPSRKTAIRLCLALHTNLLEALALLEKAGFCLTYSKKEDLVIIYCIEHGVFDVDDVNDALLSLNYEGII